MCPYIVMSSTCQLHHVGLSTMWVSVSPLAQLKPYHIDNHFKYCGLAVSNAQSLNVHFLVTPQLLYKWHLVQAFVFMSFSYCSLTTILKFKQLVQGNVYHNCCPAVNCSGLAKPQLRMIYDLSVFLLLKTCL